MTIGKRLLTVSFEDRSEGQTLSLDSWDPSNARLQTRHPLATGKQLWPMISSDRQYLFVHDKHPEAGQPWWIYDIQTGEQVAMPRGQPWAVAGTVLDPLVFFLVDHRPRSPARKRILRALDRDSGQLRWSIQLRPPPWFPPPR